MSSSRRLLNFSPPLTFSFRTHLFSSQKPNFLHFPPKRCGPSHAAGPRPVQVELNEIETLESAKYVILKKKLEDNGIDSGGCKIGEYNRMICPECDGGDFNERSLSVFIPLDVNSAYWHCFRAKCGWRGQVWTFGSGKAAYSKPDEIATIKRNNVITEESIGLEPLCDEILAYFAERMISGETLRRNGVMQKTAHLKNFIAFTYRRNGVLTSCKYRDINKKFWQERDTEKILYGLDDIKEASDIIIVEGEIDKLSLEEAGFSNCVGVPDGAPSKVSKKDTRYQYLWNCKEYLDKASRIILATDADAPGQALAEELARRLGRERCWRVKWPKKNTNEVYKDANEVLMCLGPRALQEVIDQAELYPIHGFSVIDSYYHQNLGYELGTSTELMAQDGSYKLLEEKSRYAKNCTPVQVEQKEINTLESERYVALKKELEVIGIDSSGCKIGEINQLICPWCDGGDSKTKSFTLYIHQDGDLAKWKCYRARCGWGGQARVNPYSSVAGFR